MRKFFLIVAMCTAGTAHASDVGFGIDTGRSTMPREILGALIDTKNIPPAHGNFVEINFIVYNKAHRASWLLSFGNSVFDWDNPPSLKHSQFDVSGSGMLTALTLEKQMNVYSKERFDAHFRTGVGAGKLTTTLDKGSLLLLLRNRTESGYVPLVRMSGGVAYHPNSQIAFGLDAGWGYLWEESRLSMSCRF